MSAVNPSMIAGALFAVSWFLLIDAWIMMNREPDPKNHVTFGMVMPALITTMGFFIINITSPADVLNGGSGFSSDFSSGGGQGVECSKPFAFLFIGWFISIGSTIMALSLVGVNFMGETTRTQVFPAVAMIFHSCIVPCVGAMMWFAKSDKLSAEDDGW